MSKRISAAGVTDQGPAPPPNVPSPLDEIIQLRRSPVLPRPHSYHPLDGANSRNRITPDISCLSGDSCEPISEEPSLPELPERPSSAELVLRHQVSVEQPISPIVAPKDAGSLPSSCEGFLSCNGDTDESANSYEIIDNLRDQFLEGASSSSSLLLNGDSPHIRLPPKLPPRQAMKETIESATLDEKGYPIRPPKKRAFSSPITLVQIKERAKDSVKVSTVSDPGINVVESSDASDGDAVSRSNDWDSEENSSIHEGYDGSDEAEPEESPAIQVNEEQGPFTVDPGDSSDREGDVEGDSSPEQGSSNADDDDEDDDAEEGYTCVQQEFTQIENEMKSSDEEEESISASASNCTSMDNNGIEESDLMQIRQDEMCSNSEAETSHELVEEGNMIRVNSCQQLLEESNDSIILSSISQMNESRTASALDAVRPIKSPTSPRDTSSNIESSSTSKDDHLIVTSIVGNHLIKERGLIPDSNSAGNAQLSTDYHVAAPASLNDEKITNRIENEKSHECSQHINKESVHGSGEEVNSSENSSERSVTNCSNDLLAFAQEVLDQHLIAQDIPTPVTPNSLNSSLSNTSASSVDKTTCSSSPGLNHKDISDDAIEDLLTRIEQDGTIDRAQAAAKQREKLKVIVSTSLTDNSKPQLESKSSIKSAQSSTTPDVIDISVPSATPSSNRSTHEERSNDSSANHGGARPREPRVSEAVRRQPLPRPVSGQKQLFGISMREEEVVMKRNSWCGHLTDTPVDVSQFSPTKKDIVLEPPQPEKQPKYSESPKSDNVDKAGTLYQNFEVEPKSTPFLSTLDDITAVKGNKDSVDGIGFSRHQINSRTDVPPSPLHKPNPLATSSPNISLKSVGVVNQSFVDVSPEDSPQLSSRNFPIRRTDLQASLKSPKLLHNKKNLVNILQTEFPPFSSSSASSSASVDQTAVPEDDISNIEVRRSSPVLTGANSRNRILTRSDQPATTSTQAIVAPTSSVTTSSAQSTSGSSNTIQVSSVSSPVANYNVTVSPSQPPVKTVALVTSTETVSTPSLSNRVLSSLAPSSSAILSSSSSATSSLPSTSRPFNSNSSQESIDPNSRSQRQSIPVTSQLSAFRNTELANRVMPLSSSLVSVNSTGNGRPGPPPLPHSLPRQPREPREQREYHDQRETREQQQGSPRMSRHDNGVRDSVRARQASRMVNRLAGRRGSVNERRGQHRLMEGNEDRLPSSKYSNF